LVSDNNCLNEDGTFNLDYDFLIEQDFIKREFRFRFNYELKKLHQHDIFKSKNIELYLTSINNPHILYRSFKLNLFEISQYEWYTLKFDEIHPLKSDFYTSRYFSKYLHIVVKEEIND
jgi:hypothetical protein